MSHYEFRRRLDDIKASIALASYIEKDGHKLIKNGSLWKMCCPFHREKTPSCVIYPDGHAHCLSPDTNVILSDFSGFKLGNLSKGDRIVGFDENCDPQNPRKSRVSFVKEIRGNKALCLRIVTDSSEMICTADHKFLIGLKGQNKSLWRDASKLKPGVSIRSIKTDSVEFDEDYMAGYIMGCTEGDGTWRYDSSKGNYKTPQYWRVAQCDTQGLTRLAVFLNEFGVKAPIRPFNGGADSPRKFHTRQEMFKVEVRNMEGLAIIDSLLNHRPSDSYARGYLAGMFDSEGTISGTEVIPCINQDQRILDDTMTMLKRIGFSGTNRKATNADIISLKSTHSGKLHFFSATRPAITRKSSKIIGHRIDWDSQVVVSSEWIGMEDIVEIETSTATLFANGTASHNCFGCDAHFDVFQYVMKRDGCDFKAAVERLENGHGGAFRRPEKRVIQRPKEPELPRDYFEVLIKAWGNETLKTDRALLIFSLSETLGVTVESLANLTTVVTGDGNFAFPMHDHSRYPIGIRIRDQNGRKWAVKGSKQGLFIPASGPQKDLYITEGPTDCAAMLSMGLFAIGKASAMQGPEEIVKFIVKNRVRRVIVIADNDTAGLNGAKKLIAACPVPCCELVLPAKDAREFYRNGGTRELIEALLKSAVWRNPKP